MSDPARAAAGVPDMIMGERGTAVGDVNCEMPCVTKQIYKRCEVSGSGKDKDAAPCREDAAEGKEAGTP